MGNSEVVSKTPIFEAKGICKDYSSPHGQNIHVLDQIDLTLYSNEIVAVIGPSGSGKSTFLRIAAGLIPPTSGQILVRGQKFTGPLPGMSMVFQTFALYPWMTVQENIEIVLKAARVSAEEMEKRTREAIDLIGLVGFEESYPKEISGGMKQRVGMARALVRKPEMLFMDEPFSEVDAFTAEALRSELLRIWSDKTLELSSILFVSHDVREVVYLADRIVVLGMHPTTVRTVIENKIPRPRDPHSEEFNQLVEELHDTYGHIETFKKEPRLKEESPSPVVYAAKDQILGLLRYLQAQGSSQDIFKIGAEIHQHFDKVATVLDAALLLGFVEILQRTVSITSKGEEFLQGTHSMHRELWREQLLKIPLFSQLCNLLRQTPNQSLDRNEILHFLKQTLPSEDANTQLNTLIRWGRYGDLFLYHKKEKRLTLQIHTHQ